MACLELLCKKHFDSHCVESTAEINAFLNLDPVSLTTTVESSDSEISAFLLKDHSTKSTVETSSDIECPLNLIQYAKTLLEASSELEDGVTVDYSISEELISTTEIAAPADKFNGDFPDFTYRQKLYPSGDVNVSDFISSSETKTDLYSFIDEGVYLGTYPSGATLPITDNVDTYITPEIFKIDGKYSFKAELDEPIVKPTSSRIIFRISAPYENEDFQLSPVYTLKNIKFQDPDGNLIVKYNDLVFQGDAKDSDVTKRNNFVTYSVSPKTNNLLEKLVGEQGYPDLQQKHGYSLSFDVEVDHLGDPFDEGYNEGFEEDYSPLTENLRISSIELHNSGLFGPGIENALSIYLDVIPTGYQLERKIYPTEFLAHDFDTGIHPESGNLWFSKDGDSNTECKPYTELLSYIRNHFDKDYIINENDISDSGKLILKFGTGKSSVSQVSQGAFNVAFDQSIANIWTSPTFSDGRFHPSGAFNTENTDLTDDIDDIFFNIDSISLMFRAKKNLDTPDFAVDVVGYSDDRLLSVTSPVSGFLQSSEGIGNFPASSGFSDIDDLGLSSEAISDKFQYFESSGNPGGDHYRLATLPVVNTTEFADYEIPLKIYDDEVQLGLARDFSFSNFFEHLYLDIFPFPSGATISNMHLVVRYRPQDGLNLATQGGKDISRRSNCAFSAGFYPSTKGSNDDYLNAGSGYNPLSLIESIPHGYKSPDTLKTNYSRRWRGMKGLSQGPYDINQFSLAFESPLLDTPLTNAYFNFEDVESSTISSKDLGSFDVAQGGFTEAGIPVSPEVFKNIGFRFKSDSIFQTSLPGYTSDYKTADWTALSNGGINFQANPLYGQIFDGYDNLVRFNANNNFQLSNVDLASGIAIFVRFIPEENSTFNNENIFSISSSPTIKPIRLYFDNGNLTVGINSTTTISDSLSYEDYQYPLSVLVTYNDNHDQRVRLYTDNELNKGGFTHLRAVSDPVNLPELNVVLDLGNDSTNNSLPMLVSEFGFSTPVVGSGTNVVFSNPDRNLREITAQEFFDNHRSKFFDPGESQANDTFKLWDYVNENPCNDWVIGDYKHCSFSPDFSIMTKRTNRDLVAFELLHDGTPYSQDVDLPFPSTIDSGVSYHTQVENDFLRFHLSDTDNSFYSIYPRIRKSLPRGYKFTEQALMVETILEHKFSGDISWPNCKVGPKLIVSLYTKNQEPYYQTENFGLVNRSVHYIHPEETCTIRIDSKFTYDDIIEDSEAWSFFPAEAKAKEFGEKLFSDDVNDMFLQYDLVYPSGTEFRSRLNFHTCHVRADDVLSNYFDDSDNLNLIASGAFVEDAHLDLFARAGSGVADSILLYASGQDPIPDSGSLSLSTFAAFIPSGLTPLNLFVANRTFANEELGLYSSGAQPILDSGALNLSIVGLGVSSGIMSMVMFNDFEAIPVSGNINLFTFAPSSGSMILGSYAVVGSDGGTDLTGMFSKMGLSLFNDHRSNQLISYEDSLNLFSRGKFSPTKDYTSEAMSLFIDSYQGFDRDTDLTDTSKTFSNQAGTLFASAAKMPLFLNAEPKLNENFASLSLFTYNIYGNKAVFQWDGFNYGSQIEEDDNVYSSLSLDNEIRGVVTVGYGHCDSDSPAKALDQNLELDDIIYEYGDCNNAGIFRGIATYTNPNASGFDGTFGAGYLNNYYDIRKFTGLDPSTSYDVFVNVRTGETEGIEQPRNWEEWEYGICGPNYHVSGCCTEDCDQELNYSGIKLLSDFGDLSIIGDSGRLEEANYGKAVAVNKNLMAVSAPNLTIADEHVSGVEDAGAVFLYARDEEVAGKKANWQVSRKLTLPSGFVRDYVESTRSSTIKYYNDQNELEFEVPFQQWAIGQEGREFGHSLALRSDDTNETLVVGAPGAQWSREFEQINTSGIPICMAVFTDSFDPIPDKINDVINTSKKYDILYNYFADKWNIGNFTFQPELDIKLFIYELVDRTNPRISPTFRRVDFIKHTFVDKVASIGQENSKGEVVTQELIDDSVKSLFLDTFNQSSFPHSGLPPIMGVFLDDTRSTFGSEPIVTNFINFYNDYVYQSGVIDPETELANSGYAELIRGAGQNWDSASKLLLNQVLTTGNLIQNDALRYIASGFSSTAVEDLEQFQSPPASGGRVYVFDGHGDDLHLVQEIKSRSERLQDDADDLDEDRLDFGTQFNDRFGHSVSISKNGDIVAIGSPYLDVPCEIYERKPEENARMYGKIKEWLEHADGRFSYVPDVKFDFTQELEDYETLLTASGESFVQIAIYNSLSDSDKFYFRGDKSFWGNQVIELYKQIYEFGYSDIPYTGTWGFISNQFAPTSRLGYSSAVDHDGDLVAFGAPTDSFNIFDDTNVWYGGRTDIEDNNRWSSMTNAGAVRVFKARKFYPHNKAVEFTRFGNLDRSTHPELDYDRMATYFQPDNIPFERLPFSAVDIPQDAGLAFIITPERDVITGAGGEEVLQNIKEWLALGDRTLVLVANDPTYEENGLYKDSTNIVNTILDKIGSRMTVVEARTEEEAYIECVSGENLIKAFQPEYNHTTFKGYESSISTDSIFAKGVADIKIKLRDEEVSIFDDDGIQMPCPSKENPINTEAQLPLKQLGDLRAQWNSVCSICGPNGCGKIEYKTNWALHFDNPNPQQNCDSYPPLGLIGSPYQDPRPILTVSKKDPDESWFVPEQIIRETGYEPIFSGEFFEKSSTRTFLSNTHLDELEFNIFENPDNELGVPSGKYNAFNLNTFTNPATENFRNTLLQAQGKIVTEKVRLGNTVETISPDSPLVASEEIGGEGSKVVIIASTRPETLLNLGYAGSTNIRTDDGNISFYSNLVKSSCSNSGVIYQLGGWTGRSSFSSVSSEFEQAGGGILENTRSSITTLFDEHGHHYVENYNDYRYTALRNANVLWIADPLGYSEEEILRIRNWLDSENKTLVITYNIQPELYEEGSNGEINILDPKPFDTVTNVTKICKTLGTDIKPVYSHLTDKYIATSDIDDQTTQIIDREDPIISGCIAGYTWPSIGFFPSDFTDVPVLNVYRQDPTPGSDQTFNFIPVSSSGNVEKIIHYNEPIIDTKANYGENAYFTMSADSSITFPVVSNSGYRVFVNWVSEREDDFIPVESVVTTNGDSANLEQSRSLGKTAIGDPQSVSFDIDAGENATSLTVSFNASRKDRIELDEFINLPKSVRILSVSGCPLPKITEVTTTSGERQVIIGFNEIITETIIPASSGTIVGKFGPWSSDRDQYLRPNLQDCDPEVINESKVEDGPVVVAEELENFSSFPAGKRKSRIVVVTDSTIIQGQCPEYRNDAVGGNQKFIRSLYLQSPEKHQEFSSDKAFADSNRKFAHVQKIRSPEAGSPGKYYSKLNQDGLTRIFGKDGQPSLSPANGLASLYQNNEDQIHPSLVHRQDNPKWDQVETEVTRFENLFISTYGIAPRYSGVFQGIGPLTDSQKDLAGIPRFAFKDGKKIEINNPYYAKDTSTKGGISTIQKLLGKDYLDYIDSFSGYPGDLFGYSIAIEDGQLIVGAPFNAYDYDKVYSWPEVSGDDSEGITVSEYGGAGAAFLYDYDNLGENVKESFLPLSFNTKIKPSSVNVGVTGGITDINILNQKNLTRFTGDDDEDYRQTDQFGRSVSIASDMMAIGAPNHDWHTDHNHIYDGDSAFLRKDFSPEFEIPQHLYSEASGNAILNNGAVYTYRNEMVDFGGKRKEVQFAEKLNKNGYKSNVPPTFGTENDKFGQAVSIYRSKRTDSDYTLVAGAPRHDHETSGNHPTLFMENAGAAFTYDAMLRRQPRALPSEGGFIVGKIFGDNKDLSVPFVVNQNTAGGSILYSFNASISTNSDGEIFIEASGFDSSAKGFIAHRPFIELVTGVRSNTDSVNQTLPLNVFGTPLLDSGFLDLNILGADNDFVYNNIDLFTVSAIQDSGQLNLYVSGQQPTSDSDTLTIFTSGTENLTDILNLRIRGN